MEVIMFSDLDEIKTNCGATYHIQLLGALNSLSIEWAGDITLIPEENGKILLVSLCIDQATMRSILDQFSNLNLTVLLNHGCDNEIIQGNNA
jgi:hypothetical protein